MEYVGRDEDGRTHIGWAQEQDQSCGPACVYMVESIRGQACLVDGETRIRDLLGRYFSGGVFDFVDRLINDFHARGIDMKKLKEALDAEGFPCTMAAQTPDLSAGASYPVIAHIAWPNQGGHFIIIAGVTSGGKLVCLDPWYGFQQISKSVMPAYPAACSPRARCAVGAGGTFSGWYITLG